MWKIKPSQLTTAERLKSKINEPAQIEIAANYIA